MPPRSTTASLRSAVGFGLIEVLVSALLVVTVSLAVFTGFSAASRASGRTSAQVVAANLAQQDQERMRAMRASELVGYSPPPELIVEGRITYTVQSTGTYVLAPAKRSGCTSGRKDEYLKIVSTVSFPAQDNEHPVRLESLIAPEDAASPGKGSLLLQILRADGVTGDAGTLVGLAGPQADSETTGDEGCVFFANYPAGAYSLTYGKLGFVDPSGVSSIAIPAQIPDQQTTSLSRLYDRAGTINATFHTYANGNYATTTGSVLSAYHPGVTIANGYRSTVSATAVDALSLGALFPFPSAYTVFSGSCDSNAIPVGTLRTQLDSDVYRQSVLVGAGALPAVSVFEPAINARVRYQTGASTYTPQIGNLVIRSTNAACPSSVSLTSLPDGRLPVTDRGFPYGSYDTCAEVQTAGVWRRSALRTVPASATSARETTFNLDIPNTGTTARCAT